MYDEERGCVHLHGLKNETAFGKLYDFLNVLKQDFVDYNLHQQSNCHVRLIESGERQKNTAIGLFQKQQVPAGYSARN